MPSENSLTAYLHIPKTAGQSVYPILRRNYVNVPAYLSRGGGSGIADLRAMSTERQLKLGLVYGHIPYGIHELLKREVIYITVLRHPVDRIISHYNFVKQVTHHYLHEHVMEHDMSLEAYATSRLSGELDNGQTRFLMGLEGETVSQVDDTHYEEALHNLRNNIHAVGIQEHFDLSMLLFQHRLKWKTPFYVRKNVTKRKAPAPSEQVRAIIAEHNRYDMKLYNEAYRIFGRQVAESVPNADLKLFVFQQVNKIVRFFRS